MPAVPPELMNRANAALQANRHDECLLCAEQILVMDAKHVPALVLAGIACMRQERLEAALDYFEKAKSADGRCAPAFLWSSMVLRRLGRVQEALADAQKAISLGQVDPLTLHHLAQCHIDLQQFASALPLLHRAYGAAPSISAIHLALGLAHQGLGNSKEAISSFRRALTLEPNNLEVLNRLRVALQEEGETRAAADIAAKIHELQPDSAEATLWLAKSYIEDSRASLAHPLLEKALLAEPDSSLAHSLLGNVFQMSGQLEAAGAEFRRSIEIEPKQGSAYLALVSNQKIKDIDRPLLTQMEEVQESGELLKSQLSVLEYAMGKACEDLGDYAAAMGHYDNANRIAYELKFGTQKFDATLLGPYDRLAKMTAEPIRKIGTAHTTDSAKPILVVGMIRSGTTLVEQILSSHSEVGAAGEQKFWLEFGASAIGGNGTRVESEILARLAARYDRLLSDISPGSTRVVDKMPQNYQALGLIHLAVPGAKIIHIRRHPIDTCLSIYATPNRSRLRWAHNKANIATAYEKYLRTMEAWRSILPPSILLEVDYEELTRNPEPNIRRLVEFCELEWDDACLQPEKNERTVNTPSVWQVRQPIYRTSVARWEKFKPWLGEFARLVKQDGPLA